jgi:hypothetical protein
MKHGLLLPFLTQFSMGFYPETFWGQGELGTTLDGMELTNV